MQTKLSKLKAAYAAGDTVAALRIAARFPRLGRAKEPITRAWAAYGSPDLYREMGQDPAALIQAGIAAMAELYGLA